jgi:hypothetical protein
MPVPVLLLRTVQETDGSLDTSPLQTSTLELAICSSDAVVGSDRAPQGIQTPVGSRVVLTYDPAKLSVRETSDPDV